MGWLAILPATLCVWKGRWWEMARFWIEGGHPLAGELAVHGAKNAALPLLAASLLCGESCLENCPPLSDVEVSRRILEHLGCRTRRSGSRVHVWQGSLPGSAPMPEIPEGFMGAMRSSIVFLGAMLARWGRARLFAPGGCELGPRPIDMHLDALGRMGAVIEERDGALECSCPKGLHGAVVTLPFPSVGATENVLLAAVTARGCTVLHNPAREPEISDLVDFLNEAGGDIRPGADGSLVIQGVPRLEDCCHRVIPDRIATATFLCAAAATGGEVWLRECRPDHLAAVTSALGRMGCQLAMGADHLFLKAPAVLQAPGTVKTMPYPGFPTDGQAPLMALCTLAQGATVFVENIFSARYKHAAELVRMGADITVEGRVAVVRGVGALHGAHLHCTDLRAGAALAIAALSAAGESWVEDVEHVDRGYDRLEESLAQLGAVIKRES